MPFFDTLKESSMTTTNDTASFKDVTDDVIRAFGGCKTFGNDELVMPKYVNLTPHDITIHVGGGVYTFPPSGTVARVAEVWSEMENTAFQYSEYGEIEGLPASDFYVFYIVSGLVAQAVWATTNRIDVVSPATGHPDCRRDEKGRILSVPFFKVRGPKV
jgi:hypothetical protein